MSTTPKLAPALKAAPKKPRPVVVPEGYRLDARGRLCPVETIKPIDLARDELVLGLIKEAKLMNAALHAFREGSFRKADDFVALSAAQYGARLGGRKGNISLTTFDGKYKVLLAIAENVTFDERLQAAKALIDECINEWAEDSPAELKTLVTQAFDTDKEGKLNVGRILSLRRYQIDDRRWLRAMKAIGESLQVIGSKRYVRFYEREADGDRYTAIPIDVAGV